MSLDEESLREALRSPGFRPRRAHLAPLLERLAAVERDEAELIERALARLGREAAEAAMRRFPTAALKERSRLCRLVGRVAKSEDDLGAWLRARLEDDDERTRRQAANALGRIGGEGVEAALLARFAVAGAAERRSLVEALGKIGGEVARAALDQFRADDAELARIVEEARLRLRRTLERRDRGIVDGRASAADPLAVVLHCRRGLAVICAEELDDELKPRVVDDGTVAATLVGPLDRLWRARTALRFGFPLPAQGSDPGEAVVAALTSERALAILKAFTRGSLRFRIEWASAGRRRGLTYRVAEAISRARPELVNDPTESLWEAIVDEREQISVELWPRGLEDPRFSYRVEHVPASSHPTVAAALARVAGVRGDDVVWDPFVGAGTELVERAGLGNYARLFGSDLDERALERARANLKRAEISAELSVGDARRHRPPLAPTLILTNPPMGRRVLNAKLTGALYDEFLAHAARLLVRGGRLVWISPRGDETARRAGALGLKLRRRLRVDMAGFWGELQCFEK